MSRGKTGGEEIPPEGVWPSWRSRVWADLLPSHFAPSQDGLKAPDYERPEFLRSPAATSNDSLELARFLHQEAESRATAAEARSGRAAQTSLALLALTFTAVGFQAARLRQLNAPTWVWLVALLPASIAVVSLTLCALQAIGVEQRVRLSFPPILDEIANARPSVQRRLLVEQMDRAAFIANWSATKRLDQVLQAGAWLTRGIVALVLVGGVTIAVWSAEPVGGSPSDTTTNTQNDTAPSTVPTTPASSTAGTTSSPSGSANQP